MCHAACTSRLFSIRAVSLQGILPDVHMPAKVGLTTQSVDLTQLPKKVPQRQEAQLIVVLALLLAGTCRGQDDTCTALTNRRHAAEAASVLDFGQAAPKPQEAGCQPSLAAPSKQHLRPEERDESSNGGSAS